MPQFLSRPPAPIAICVTATDLSLSNRLRDCRARHGIGRVTAGGLHLSLLPKEIAGLLECRNGLITKICKLLADRRRRDPKDAFAQCVYPPFRVHHQLIASLPSGQNQSLGGE